MDIQLLSDHRESKVNIHLEHAFNQENTFSAAGSISYNVEQLETGDYIIQSDDKILAVIERKTYDDYGASIKDGRTNKTSNRCNQFWH